MSLPWPTLTEAEWREKLGMRAAYSPDQPRDKRGRWTDGGVAFHGTTRAAAEQILREGIRADMAGRVHPSFSRKGVTYVTSDLEQARAWSRSAARSGLLRADEGDPETIRAVVHLTVPPGTAFLPDQNFADGENDPEDITGPKPSQVLFEHQGDIPAAWVKAVEILTKPSGFDATAGQWLDDQWQTYTIKDGKLVVSAAGQTWYAVVFFDPSAFRAAYDANQPRVPAGSPAGGQWTSSGVAGSTPVGEAQTAALSSAMRDHVAAVVTQAGHLVIPPLPNRFGQPGYSIVDQRDLKADVVAGLAQAADVPYAIANRYVDHWAETAGGDAEAALMQMAVQKAFHLTEAASDHLRVPDTDVALDPIVALARAEYARTQAWLQARGITEVTVYRGQHGVSTEIEWRDQPQEFDTVVTTQPASSWSLSRSVAEEFTFIAPDGLHQRGDPYVLTTTVPAARILSLPVTGRGALSEAEVILLGGPVAARVRFGHRHTLLQDRYRREQAHRATPPEPWPTFPKATP